MNTITLTIRYRARSKPVKVNISIDKDRATIEEIAMLAAKQLTIEYSKYVGGIKNMKQLKRYEFGQYKLILHELEGKV